MEQNKNIYIVGEVNYLRSLFPGYGGNDERFSVDGSNLLIEFHGEGALLARLRNDEDLKVMSHSEALDFLHDGVEWNPSVEGAPMKMKRKRIE